MEKTYIYTLTSELHDGNAIEVATHHLLDDLSIDYVYRGSDYSDYGKNGLSIIYVRTGGTEGKFLKLFQTLKEQTSQPFYLLASNNSNSLAASMEIMSFLRQQGQKGEIIHGTREYVNHRITELVSVAEAIKRLNGCRLGVIGTPSDWLISSQTDNGVVLKWLGIDLIDIPIDELIEDIRRIGPQKSHLTSDALSVKKALPVAESVYVSLKNIISKYKLNGFSLRCFDLLTSVSNTGCLALARLNSEGFVAGCEGDVPAMLSMMIARSLTGVSGFQANPASIDPVKGQMVFAHCTIPLNMVSDYELDTHFESGIGVAIRGHMNEGPVTLFKISGNLERAFIAEGTLVRNQMEPDFCRTQQVIRLGNPALSNYFLSNPIGNHHIVIPGHVERLIRDFITTVLPKCSL